MDVHRAALLREARHFHHARAFAVDVGRLRQNRADGDNAGAADAGDDDVERAVDRGNCRRWQVGQDQFGGRFFTYHGPFQ